MCGIVGALVFDSLEKKSEEKMRNEAIIFLTTQLLQATVERGKDATGVSLLWSDGMYAGLKMGIPSPEFIARFGGSEKDFEGFLKLWREYTKQPKVFLGHCRKSSVGNSYDNKNNHPLQVGDVIFVHNGTLTNHDKIFENLGCDRHGEVDSEAIGRLLTYYTNNGSEPFTREAVVETTRRLHGTYSVLAANGNNPYQVAQFRDGRPAEMVLVKPLKTVFVASEKKFLENVLFEYNKMSKLFASEKKFPYVKKDDVDFKMLPDDSIALWDLTVPVTDKTTITDLYDWEKAPLRGEKIWSSYTTNTYNSTAGSFGKKTTGTEVRTQQRNKSTGSSTKMEDSADADGLVWSKSLNKYKTQAGINKSRQLGSVTIDVEKGSLVELDAKGNEVAQDIEIKEVTEGDVEDLISNAAEIKELSYNKVGAALSSLASGKKSDKSSVDSKPKSTGNTVEVDMTADPEAIKKANEYVEKGLMKYEKDEEVAEELDVSDASVLRPLPLFALANRIKKYLFRQGFMVGYTARKREEPAKRTVETDYSVLKKLDSAEKQIRTLKMVVRVLAHCLSVRTHGNSQAVIESLIKDGVNAIVKSKRAKTKLMQSFSEGDFKKIPLLKEVSKAAEVESEKK